mmetsp:Transcript_44668/g.50577  ORF Transcript_44668/g.50577 Transcript_44668/m.50577 type:complete len:319 (-) Transcript_44668:2031-2987(-)
MNLNISIDDLRRGKYESQKNQLLHHLVRKRAVIGDPEGGNLPSCIVRSELLVRMVQACGETGVVVVHADRGLGKSTAAKSISKFSAGGIMFCNSDTPSSGCYWKGVASAVGIPKEVYENNSDWETLLVVAVAAAISPAKASEIDSWIDRLMHISLSICGCGGGGDEDASDVIPTIPGMDLSFLRKKPIMVFDDFNDVGEDDIKFMKSLYPIVKAKEVLLFVMVRDEDTANRLLKLNNWGRIAPLPGICRNISRPEDKEKIPEWTAVKWTQVQLENIVRSNFGEIPTSMPEIIDGANPLDILDVARRKMFLEQADIPAL